MIAVSNNNNVKFRWKKYLPINLIPLLVINNLKGSNFIFLKTVKSGKP